MRWFLDHDPNVLRAVVGIFLREVERSLRRRIQATGGPRGRGGAVAALQHFGSTLNRHTHVHALVADGVFAAAPDGTAVFHEVPATSDEDVRAVEATVRRKTLRLLARRGCLEAEVADEMASWQGSGFSVDASVRIEAHDRAGLERLARYCVRPPFALERLGRDDNGDVLYQLKKPAAGGRTVLRMTPHEFLARLVALLPRPRRHLVRYWGVFASHATLRAQVVPATPAAPTPPAAAPPEEPSFAQKLRRRRLAWAALIARIYEDDPLSCRRCGAPMKLIAFVTEPRAVRSILEHLGEPLDPPALAPARGPPRLDLFFDEPATVQ